MRQLISIPPSKHAGACVAAAKTTLGNVLSQFFSSLFLYIYISMFLFLKRLHLKEGNYESGQNRGLSGSR